MNSYTDCIKLPRDRNGVAIYLDDWVRSPENNIEIGQVYGILLRNNGTSRIQVHHAGLCDAYLYPQDLEHVEES